MVSANQLFSRRLLLVEDEQLMRSLISNLLSQHGFEVEACGSAAEAAHIVSTFDPDVLVVDISLGEGPNGIDLIHAMRNAYPHLAFVVLSNYAVLPTSIQDLSEIAYLRKRDVADPQILVSAVEQVLRDFDASKSFPITQSNALSALTNQQVEVLALMASGLSNQEIALRRGTTVQSTEQLIGRIYKALSLKRNSTKSLRVQATSLYLSIVGTRGSQ